MMTRCCIDELSGNSNASAEPAHAALEEILDAKLAAGADHVDVAGAIAKRRIARDDMELPEARQLGDDILGDAVRKILLVSIAAYIGKG